ncbi:hypothetical protein DRF65_20370 [Chryseobacterium pennae]|uniref:Uncharacterized protein n=1 Tax=Chryseobacterium pennae TaxID=2258962 RepID=A0A3D9C420_9FLAO|nr:hypothetical protein DRF65_20370 [Chryseobacterium pennae]
MPRTQNYAQNSVYYLHSAIENDTTFDISIDQIINYCGSIPKEIILANKTEPEQIRFIEQPEKKDKQTIFRLG